MNKFTHFKSFNPLFTFILFVAVALMSACGGDDEPDPEPIDCSTLALTATAERTTITAVATGGEAPYKFRLDEGTAQSSGTFTVGEFGSYEVTVTDANECEKKTTVQVVDPCANFSVSATASAYDLTIAVTDGTAPFKYSFENGDSTYEAEVTERTVSFELVEAENTTITITDANECVTTTEVTAEAITTFTDNDDQIYEVVKIGDQIWFAENYNKETEEGSYCYGDEESNCEIYGKLYTWDVAQEIAPTGWELPSADQWEKMINFLGAETAGDQLRNSSGFELKSGGYRTEDSFIGLGQGAGLWTNTSNPNSDLSALSYEFEDDRSDAPTSFKNKGFALSVRLIKKM